MSAGRQPRSSAELGPLEVEVDHMLVSLGSRHRQRALQNIMALLAAYSGLKVKSDTFVTNAGVAQQMLQVLGTIPVMYKGSCYNIPIGLWLSADYPYRAPVCYVVPTPTMCINPSNAVNANGLVQHPYLAQWSPGHNLLSFVQDLCLAFGQDCPVTQKADYPQGGPANLFATDPLGNPVGPPTSLFYPGNQLANGTDFNANSGPGLPTFPYGNGGQSFAGYGSMPPPPPPRADGIDQYLIHMSLHTAVHEKFQRTLPEVESQQQLQLDKNLADASRLEAGKAQLDRLLTAMAEESTQVCSAIEIYKQENDQLSRQLQSRASHSSDASTEAEELVVAPYALYGQMLRLVAEQAAIQDTIYYLGKALHKGALDIDEYLKHVRALSRRQYIAWATLSKAQLLAGVEG